MVDVAGEVGYICCMSDLAVLLTLGLVPNVEWGFWGDVQGRDVASKADVAYPQGAIDKEETGTCVVKFFVYPDGRARNITVESTSGFPDLDMALVSAVSNTRWEPREGINKDEGHAKALFTLLPD